MVQSLIVVALQTQGYAALVQIFTLLAARADELESTRARGMWAGAEGAQQFWNEKRPGLTANMENLWLEFWGGIDHPAPHQK